MNGDSMSAIEERDNKVAAYLEKLYALAKDKSIKIDESAYHDEMDGLFKTKAWGFREILLVVVVGMYLDHNFHASTGLYDCNPRAIYEGPIKKFLIDKELPHRKSGPLNVAKATVGLDETWAAQRRPSAAAESVVDIVNYLEKSSEDEAKQKKRIDSVAISLLRRLISYSSHLENLSVEIEPDADPDFLYMVCRKLVDEAPDSGNTPQKIAAFLLKSYHETLHTKVNVTGGEDRASVTSTTSHKPGDVNEESSEENEIYKVYEITIKPFDLARIQDSYDAVTIYNKENGTYITEIIVICRPQDCPKNMVLSGLEEYMGHYSYQNVMYYYWNIYEWMASTLQRMTDEGRQMFYSLLNNYINDINTAEIVKQLWHDIHTKHLDKEGESLA